MTMPTILKASDFHISDDLSLPSVLTFRSLVETSKPEILILEELFDPWKDGWDKILSTKSHQVIQLMAKHRLQDGQETIYLKGNHDWSAKSDYLHYTELCTRYQVGDILFLHGWEFAFDWQIISPFAFWIAKHHPDWAIHIYHLLYGHTKTPGSLKHHQTRDDWNRKIGLIHLKAMDYAIKNGVRLVVGHTHCPTPFNGIFADSGDMIDSFSYIWIHQNKIELKYL